MSSPRLQQQFIRLWQHFQGQTTDTTLQELTGVLNCSRRHIRSLLNAMQQEGWLVWQAEAGRGKRSQLSFVYTGLALQQQRAEDLLEQDRIEQLVQLVGDKEAVRQMLLAHLGRSFRQGKHILRILYYRPLRNLQPGSALRRSEMHIARQIFSGLTNINEENGEVEPDLAHHWQRVSLSALALLSAPGYPFSSRTRAHDGRHHHVTLSSYSAPAFSHIESVTSPMPFVIDIRLNSPDNWLPWLLGSVHAMILPQEWQTLPDFAQHPIGTGPYAVVRNNSNQLKIRAFDDYFGYRALIDEVNIWVLPDEPEEMPVSIQLQSDNSRHEQLESRMEEGGYFLLFDKRSPLASRPEAQRWLRQIFNPISLLNHANTSNQRDWSPAYSLLPRWHHHHPDVPQSIPKGLTDVTLTFYQAHPEYRILSEIMRTLLAQHGVTLHIQTVSYEDWYQGNADSDIWFGSLNCYLPIEFSLFAMLYELPLAQHCLNDDLHADAQQWRNQTLPMAEWCEKLIASGQLHPLLHHWLQLQGQRSMRGVRMNMLGWFDFKSAWFAPPER
nr:HTH-type transcriptional regulator SgrR [Pectobacterium sp. PL152]